ncbi:class I SAM-dependent rRNA methyltransferase [Pelagibaculum spongiae]|uniref:SAM-dependent methyltransferase n=1 Tax=Pelagibaculum spongiae TaxID=2080658 RepID=A0A2V1GTL4_9GAMM|nr:class I SAM-dependent methyltransferase [Pelagibaculum spongiae]PVZ68354.1 SAM-dependent methyltransferase [Pelagibaculum spongiae]
MNELLNLLSQAWLSRSELQAQWQKENTDCYRIFHGTNEGLAGTTLDRYGPLLILQTFHEALSDDQYAQVKQFSAQQFPDLHLVYNDRSPSNSRIKETVSEQNQLDRTPLIGHELGINYRVQGRHQGQDPWLFLDLRAGRRYVKENCAGKTVLNLFSYTCGIGIAAAVGGAKRVVNVDFAESSLAVGIENAQLNDLTQVEFIQSDVFPAIKQFAKLPITTRRNKKLPSYPRHAAEQFDLVFLDPPRWAKSAFGNVDLIRDYQSLFKPSLLATKEGGQLICCNNVAQVDRDEWLELLQRCAIKAGRPLKSIEVLLPDSDFPSPDGNPPLKIAICQL